MPSGKQLYFIATAIIVAIVIAIIGYGKRAGDVTSQEVSPSPSPSVVESGKPTGTLKSGSTGTSAKTYTDYVKAYEGRRIQFDINCQAVPSSTTYKTGVQVMFDNRSGDTRKIKVGDTSYDFPGYGYKILTLSSKSLPKNLFLSCGSAVNVGQILLQK